MYADGSGSQEAFPQQMEVDELTDKGMQVQEGIIDPQEENASGELDH